MWREERSEKEAWHDFLLFGSYLMKFVVMSTTTATTIALTFIHELEYLENSTQFYAIFYKPKRTAINRKYDKRKAKENKIKEAQRCKTITTWLFHMHYSLIEQRFQCFLVCDFIANFISIFDFLEIY